MDANEGLAFLAAHQPLPDDHDLTQVVIDQYDEVRRYFIAHPDPRCVPLFLGSFGDGVGWGVYQLVDEVMRAHPGDVVVRGLDSALASPHLSVRSWALQIAMDYADRRLVPHFKRSLFSDDHEERYWAAQNLAINFAPEDAPVLRLALSRETEPSVLEVLRSVPCPPL